MLASGAVVSDALYVSVRVVEQARWGTVALNA
jgi:hypothetical protein